MFGKSRDPANLTCGSPHMAAAGAVGLQESIKLVLPCLIYSSRAASAIEVRDGIRRPPICDRAAPLRPGTKTLHAEVEVVES